MQTKNRSELAMSGSLFVSTHLRDLFPAYLLTLLLIGGRFLPFAIYSQTDSPQECQSNEKYHETKLFSCQRDHQGLHSRHEYPHPPQAKWLLNGTSAPQCHPCPG